MPGSVLKIEDDNFGVDKAQRPLWCYMISAKRYVLYTHAPDGTPTIVKASEHGLGHLLNPTDPEDESRDWIAGVWRVLLDEALTGTGTVPSWAPRPAISRVTISSPALLAPFAATNAGKPYAARVKPFNFLLSAHVDRLGHPVGTDPAHFHLVLPYERDAKKWTRGKWIDRYTGARFRISTGANASPTVARVKSYEATLAEYGTHPEPKSAAPDGRSCDRHTRGLLRRRSVHTRTHSHIGKESNELEMVEAGMVHEWSSIATHFDDDAEQRWREEVVPLLQYLPRTQLAVAAKVSTRTITSVRNGHSVPSGEIRRVLTSLVRIGGSDRTDPA